jgi:glycosyltransferase involved in cell wall biosynthesis
MRILHVVKTADGASWAARQAQELVKLGIEVHVALPDRAGRVVERWRAAGAAIHVEALDYPVRRPWLLPERLRRARALVLTVAPDLIHSHFVGTSILLRQALGKRHAIPRIFQVPGPLHLEHRFFRNQEIRSVGPSDYWVASSRYIADLYRKAGIPPEKLFLSYYGLTADGNPSDISGTLRDRLGIGPDAYVAGNISYIYPPKLILSQRTGLKGHENLIDGLALALSNEERLVGVLAGGTFSGSDSHELKLRRRAAKAGRGRIHMPGFLAENSVSAAWREFDCALHVPLSENCGGVVEPLLQGVPVIAAAVGGIPEVVIDGITGTLLADRRPRTIAAAIRAAMANPERGLATASLGQRLVREMFDPRRTAQEIREIYRFILGDTSEPPQPYDSLRRLRDLKDAGSARGASVERGRE